jgi:hypothetical protein
MLKEQKTQKACSRELSMGPRFREDDVPVALAEKKRCHEAAFFLSNQAVA